MAFHVLIVSQQQTKFNNICVDFLNYYTNSQPFAYPLFERPSKCTNNRVGYIMVSLIIKCQVLTWDDEIIHYINPKRYSIYAFVSDIFDMLLRRRVMVPCVFMQCINKRTKRQRPRLLFGCQSKRGWTFTQFRFTIIPGTAVWRLGHTLTRGGDTMVTYEGLFSLIMLVMAVITLCRVIFRDKDDR